MTRYDIGKSLTTRSDHNIKRFLTISRILQQTVCTLSYTSLVVTIVLNFIDQTKKYLHIL